MVNKNDNKSVIKAILKYINDLLDIVYDNNVDRDKYINNVLYRHSVHMCLFQIGELSKYVSDDFKKKHIDLPWAQMRGLRNVEAHDYDNLDLNAIWETVKSDIPVLKSKLEKLVSDI